MKTTTDRKFMTGLALAFALVTAGETSTAAQMRVYPGAMCNGLNLEDEAILKRENRIAALEDVVVSCPMINNNPDNTAAIHSYVRIFQPYSPNHPLWCVIFTHQWDGRYQILGPAGWRGVYGNYTSFDVFGPSNPSPGDTARLVCSVPKGGSIINYAVLE